MLAILRSLGDSLEVWFACHTEHGKSMVDAAFLALSEREKQSLVGF
jgi:hypothetical protein